MHERNISTGSAAEAGPLLLHPMSEEGGSVAGNLPGKGSREYQSASSCCDPSQREKEEVRGTGGWKGGQGYGAGQELEYEEQEMLRRKEGDRIAADNRSETKFQNACQRGRRRKEARSHPTPERVNKTMK
eukprot:758823-Hanusia_phi.AAC.2